MIVRRVDPTSIAKLGGILYAVIGFFCGALFGAVSLIGGSITTVSLPGLSFTLTGSLGMKGLAAVAIFPTWYAIVGFIAAFVGALVYNVLAAKVGGIELDLQ